MKLKKLLKRMLGLLAAGFLAFGPTGLTSAAPAEPATAPPAVQTEAKADDTANVNSEAASEAKADADKNTGNAAAAEVKADNANTDQAVANETPAVNEAAADTANTNNNVVKTEEQTAEAKKDEKPAVDKADEKMPLNFGFVKADEQPEPTPTFFGINEPPPQPKQTTAPSPVPAEPAAPQPEQAEAKEMTQAEVASIAKEHGYKYTSHRYGYSISCPKKPNVIPLSLIDETAKGEVLIFENDDYYMKRAWIIMCDAFDNQEVPENLASIDEDAKKAVIDRLLQTAGYELVRVADLGFTQGIYCVTAKEVMVDENGDGIPDYTMKADTQMVKTFFRGQYGGHFAIELIDNPDLTEEGVSVYHIGMLTFEELPPENNTAPTLKSAENK